MYVSSDIRKGSFLANELKYFFIVFITRYYGWDDDLDNL